MDADLCQWQRMVGLDNWLTMGWDIWKDPKFAGIRDHFFPSSTSSTSDLTSTMPIPTSYHDYMVASKTLYTLLKVPEILFNLMTDGQADLVYEGAVNLFLQQSPPFCGTTALGILEGALGRRP